MNIKRYLDKEDMEIKRCLDKDEEICSIAQKRQFYNVLPLDEIGILDDDIDWFECLDFIDKSKWYDAVFMGLGVEEDTAVFCVKVSDINYCVVLNCKTVVETAKKYEGFESSCVNVFVYSLNQRPIINDGVYQKYLVKLCKDKSGYFTIERLIYSTYPKDFLD